MKIRTNFYSPEILPPGVHSTQITNILIVNEKNAVNVEW